MKPFLPPGLRREEFVDSDTHAQALYYAGLRPEDGYDLALVTGEFGRKLHLMHGEDRREKNTFWHAEWQQEQRPDIFVRKFRSRRIVDRKPPPRRGERSDSTFITKDEFARLYAAAAFAAHCDLPCETGVTLWWRELGADDAASATELFATFLKCLNAWLTERDLPTVYFFCHENSPRAGLHTHLAVYLGQGSVKSRRVRTEFLEWRTTWVENHAPGARWGRAIRVTGPLYSSRLWHWQRFHYQMKGYDPHAVVRTALNAADGNDVMLGDLLAWPWHDPGGVEMKPRVGHSESLGPGRRRIGIPEGCGPYPLSEERARARRQREAKAKASPFAPPSAAPVAPHASQSSAVSGRPVFDSSWVRHGDWSAHKPFVSRYEDGWRDVWNLYPQQFNEWVMGVTHAALTRPVKPWQRDPTDPRYTPYEESEDYLEFLGG